MFQYIRSGETFVLIGRRDTAPDRCDPLPLATREEARAFLDRNQFLTSSFSSLNEPALRGALQELGVPQVHRLTRPQILAEVAREIGQGRIRVCRSRRVGGMAPPPERVSPTPLPVYQRLGGEAEYEIRLRFQLCPGDANGLGISDLPYVIREGPSPGGAERARGRTNGAGDVTVRIRPSEILTLHILGTQYELDLHPGVQTLDGAAAVSHAGAKKRLDILGYVTGHLQDRVSEGDDSLVDDDRDSPRAQNALQSFQADHGLISSAELTPETKSQLRSRAEI